MTLKGSDEAERDNNHISSKLKMNTFSKDKEKLTQKGMQLNHYLDNSKLRGK